jgi:hypothetical protein
VGLFPGEVTRSQLLEIKCRGDEDAKHIVVGIGFLIAN